MFIVHRSDSLQEKAWKPNTSALVYMRLAPPVQTDFQQTGPGLGQSESNMGQFYVFKIFINKKDGHFYVTSYQWKSEIKWELPG